MSWIREVDPGEAAGDLREIYREVGDRRGSIANIYKVQSLNPPALKAHLDLYMSLVYRRGGLSRAQREMVGVVVSGLNRCQYCVVHHGEALGAYERDPAVLQALPEAYREAPLSEADRAMLRYAEKLTLRPAEVREEDVEALREAGFSDADILDINLIAAYFNFVNRVVLGLGVGLEGEGERAYRY